MKKIFLIDLNQRKNLTDMTLLSKELMVVRKKGIYEVTFDMLEKEMLGGIKLKIKLES